MDLSALDELIQFLADKRSDLRLEACEYILKLTARDSDISMLSLSTATTEKSVLDRLLVLIDDDEKDIDLTAVKCLVNLSTNIKIQLMLRDNLSFWKRFLNKLDLIVSRINSFNEQNLEKIIDTIEAYFKLLNNVTTLESGAEKFIQGRYALMKEAVTENCIVGHDVIKLFEMCLKLDNVSVGAESDNVTSLFLSILVNISRLESGRNLLLRAEKNINIFYFCKVVSFASSSNSKFRKPAVKIIRNCSLDTSMHDLILDSFSLGSVTPNENVIHYLLYNLIGKTEDEIDLNLIDIFDSTESDGFPDFFLTRINCREKFSIEPDDETRQEILDCLYLLSNERKGREMMRKLNTYNILKCCHGVEENESISDRIFDVIERLLAEETEPVTQEEPIDQHSMLLGID